MKYSNVKLHDGREGIRAMLPVSMLEVPRADIPPGDAAGHPNSQEPCLDFIASSGTLDRYEEIIEPQGWRLEAYRKNPVFQNAHQYGDIIFTIGKALITEVRSADDLGKWSKGQASAGSQHAPVLYQRIQFATEANPIARIAYGLYRGGFLNAVSVGFIPLRWEEGGAGAAFSRRHLEQELLEVSAVGIPANPDALQIGLKSGAFARSDLAEALEVLHATTGGSEPGICGAINPLDQGPGREALQLARELKRLLKRG